MLKFKRRLHLLLAAAVTAITANAPANAAIFQQVYNGTVTYGYDHTGFFGAGTSLVGLAFTATYLIDDGKGTSYKSSSNDYDLNQAYGGTSRGFSSPVSAKLTVGGKTILFDGLYFSGAGKFDSHNAQSKDYVTAVSWDVKERADGTASDYGFLTNTARIDFNTFNNDTINTAAAFQPDNGDGDGSYTRGDTIAGTQTYLLFNVTQFTSSAAAVPEPASWALMMGGFGIVGGALRRRPRRIALMA